MPLPPPPPTGHRRQKTGVPSPAFLSVSPADRQSSMNSRDVGDDRLPERRPERVPRPARAATAASQPSASAPQRRPAPPPDMLASGRDAPLRTSAWEQPGYDGREAAEQVLAVRSRPRGRGRTAAPAMLIDNDGRHYVQAPVVPEPLHDDGHHRRSNGERPPGPPPRQQHEYTAATLCTTRGRSAAGLAMERKTSMHMRVAGGRCCQSAVTAVRCRPATTAVAAGRGLGAATVYRPLPWWTAARRGRNTAETSAASAMAVARHSGTSAMRTRLPTKTHF